MIKKLEKTEYKQAIDLAKRVFDEYVAKDYSEEGKKEFAEFISSTEKINALDVWGYYIEEKLIGMFATRDEMSHISLFFVDPAFMRHHFGTALFEEVVKETKSKTITVNSSPYAVRVYKRLGFVADGEEVEVNGIKFTAMKFEIAEQPDENKNYTMAELLAEEDKKLRIQARAEERMQIEYQEKLRIEKEQKHQAYIEMKERKHQEYIEMKERKHQEYLEMKEKKRLEWEAEKERRANTFEDKTRTCKKCGKEWIWTASEQKFFKERGFFPPAMCKECRASVKTINNFHKAPEEK